MEENYDKTLVKWLNNELTAEELRAFELSEEYDSYKSIVDGISKLSIPNSNDDAEEAYSALKKKIGSVDTAEVKVKKLNFSVVKIMGYAASFVLLVGMSLFFLGNTTIETSIAQQQQLTLPDHSEVTLNALSSVTYNTFFFNFNRTLDLEGEAFFDIKSGDDFVVHTTSGAIKVLGTRFNAVSRNGFFETECFEGKVQVSNNDGDHDVLTKGKKLRFSKGKKELFEETIVDKKPTWTAGKSKFKSTPLSHVIRQLESTYPVTFDYKNIETILSTPYTGLFTHDNIDSALESVFLPMGIEYIKDENNPSLILLKNRKYN